ncbi:hypothetical protein RYX36_002922 [Vicia faba]
MRALFMQSKHGKTASKENKEAKINSLSKSLKASIAVCSSKVPAPLKIEVEKKPLLFSSKTTNRLEASYSKLKTDLKETLSEKCKRVKIFWKTPAEIKLKDTWRVGAGQNSKEVHIQENRNRRDKEAIYQTAQEMPSNPNEPWDIEMDYNDSLTLEIPIEQLPDNDDPEIVDASISNWLGLTNIITILISSSSSYFFFIPSTRISSLNFILTSLTLQLLHPISLKQQPTILPILQSTERS